MAFVAQICEELATHHIFHVIVNVRGVLKGANELDDERMVEVQHDGTFRYHVLHLPVLDDFSLLENFQGAYLARCNFACDANLFQWPTSEQREKREKREREKREKRKNKRGIIKVK